MHVTARKTSSSSKPYSFAIEDDDAPCNKSGADTARSACKERFIHPTRKNLSFPIQLRGQSLYVRSDSAEGCLEFPATSSIPGLKSISNIEPEPSLDGRRYPALKPSVMPGHSSDTEVVLGVGEACSVEGCGFTTLNTAAPSKAALKNHRRKKHGGPLKGKCPYDGCYYFSSSKLAKLGHCEKSHTRKGV